VQKLYGDSPDGLEVYPDFCRKHGFCVGTAIHSNRTIRNCCTALAKRSHRWVRWGAVDYAQAKVRDQIFLMLQEVCQKSVTRILRPKISELFAHTRLNATGLRFFTVYGPWGRPDMAPTIFARAICEGAPLKLFNEGKNLRDFTYIDDIVDGVVKLLLYPPSVSSSNPPARLFNLGHNRPVETRLFVRMLEELLGRKAVVELLPPQPGDMFETCADLTQVQAAIQFAPKVPLEEGLRRFVEWFREHYRL